MTVLPAAQWFSFEDLHQNPSLNGFSALEKGFLCLKCFYKLKSMFVKSIFSACRTVYNDVTFHSLDLALPKEGKILRILLTTFLFLCFLICLLGKRKKRKKTFDYSVSCLVINHEKSK